jgi:phage FluMu protein gp41
MATAFTEIYDLFLMVAKDYKLDELYNSSVADFSTYLQGFLIFAIADFTNCKQDLESRNDSEGTFTITLTTKEKVILAKLMVMAWLRSQIQNVTQFQLNLNDKDMKTHSAAQNLGAKKEYYATLREEASQDMMDYELGGIKIDTWGGN